MHLIFQPSSLDERTTEELKYWEAMVCRYCPWLVDQKENANVTAAFVLFIPLFYLHTHTGVFAEGHMHLHRYPVTPRHAMDNDLITPRETSFVCIAQAPLIYANPNTTACSFKLIPLYFVGICRKRLFIPCAKFENKNYTSVYIR